MIISKQKKLAVFLIPKTGTYSLYSLFRNVKEEAKLDYCLHLHGNWETLKRSETLEDENDRVFLDDGYKCFAFYREPLDRAISIVNYLRRGYQLSKFYHAFFGDNVPITASHRNNYHALSPEMKAINDSVPFIEVFRKFKWFFERGPYGRTQKHWLGYPGGVELLNFHDYENELQRLLRAFDLDPAKVERQRLNESISIPHLDTLTADEIAELKDYFREDYEFFASKGITFGV